MKAVLDTCVLFPPIMREILLGVADRGLMQPLWSDRILEEWARAARRHNSEAEVRAMAPGLDLRFPHARVPVHAGLEARLHLPDPDDTHVLATAIAGSADVLVTLNASDFPQHVLRAEGVERREPDGLLWEMWSHHPEIVGAVVDGVHVKAETLAGEAVSRKALLKRARLSRLAKVV